MLKGIDPLLGPELLAVMAAMGHGDELVIADANFPAESVARGTTHGRALRSDAGAVPLLGAVLSLLPLDGHEPDPVLTMQVVGDPAAIPPVVAQAAPLVAAQGHRHGQPGTLCLLRPRAPGLCRGPVRRNPALRQFHPQERRDHPARLSVTLPSLAATIPARSPATVPAPRRG